MIRRVRLIVLALVALVGVALPLLSPGCRDATQVTLDIGLSERAQCAEIHGTAITVGVDPLDTEDRLTREFVTATTGACDPSTRAIGTLVVTPGDPGRASIVVVSAYAQTDPARCKPPLFKGCIVARRRFAFSDHRQLRMPITIDPECADVPCDAFSTCRTGKCFSSESACNGDTCTEPGALADGGTDPDAAVIPDTGTDATSPEDAGADGPTDGATDAPFDAADASDGSVVNAIPYCVPFPPAGAMLHCRSAASPDEQCGLASKCCDTAARVADCNNAVDPCLGPRYCCNDGDCTGGAGTRCVGQTPTTPGRCNMDDAGFLSCTNGVTLMCPAAGQSDPMTCSPGSTFACCQPDLTPECRTAAACASPNETRYCCVDSDCGLAGVCGPVVPGNPQAPRICAKLPDAGRR